MQDYPHNTTDSTPTPEEQIAALTAERDELKADFDALDRSNQRICEQKQAITAERDKLKRELTMIEHRGSHFLLSDARDRGHQWAARAKAAEAERNRYRDALEQIAVTTNEWPEAAKYARAALTPIEEQT